MKSSLKQKIVCPHCGGCEFEIDSESRNEIEIQVGKLVCINCNAVYPIKEGILNMMLRGNTKLENEKNGWEVFAQSENWLDPPADYLLQLPNPQKKIPADTLNWDSHRTNFYTALKGVDIQNKSILELGAGRCWSSRELALRGADVVATDIMDHKTLGLGAAETQMNHYAVFFERVVCDMNKLPFRENIFDVVFVTGSLHHTNNLSKTINDVARVLKDKGTFIAANEAAGGFYSIENPKMKGNQSGINEHKYYTLRYLFYLKKSGFRNIELLPDTAFMKRKGFSNRLFGGIYTNRFYPLKIKLLGGTLIFRTIIRK